MFHAPLWLRRGQYCPGVTSSEYHRVVQARWSRSSITPLARRAVRAAIVAPTVFAVADVVLRNQGAALFAAFGSVTFLLYVDFGGPIRQRLRSQTYLIVATSILLCVATACSSITWLAIAATLVVGFAILFSGIVSSVLAGAQTSLLVSFILPVTLIGPVSSTPDRLLGWLLAGAGSLLAIAVVWRGPTNEPLRALTARACASLAVRLRQEAGPLPAEDDLPVQQEAVDDSITSVAALRRMFLGSPYRPAGLGSAERELIQAVEQLLLFESVLDRMPRADEGMRAQQPARIVLATLGETFEHCAEVLSRSRSEQGSLSTDLDRIRDARESMEGAVMSGLPTARSIADADSDRVAADVLDSLEPSFRAQQLSLIAATIADCVQRSAAARNRSWWGHLTGSTLGDVVAPFASARARAGAHIDRHSVWLHNSIRGAIGFALTVTVANLTDVQHAFWVALGTLAVLRSSAARTGQSAVWALLGTVAGIVIGGVLVTLIGSNTAVCWILLPFVIAFTGIAPAISFAAGQAGFTVILFLIFNLITPTGWTIGIVRIEDVALGCAVSVVVGLLLWPRGASARLGAALASSLSDTVDYLHDAVGFALARCADSPERTEDPASRRETAIDSARRLDDAFREFLAERGAKQVPLADHSALLVAVAVLRRTADAICELWTVDTGQVSGERDAARHEIAAAGESVVAWYRQVAAALAGTGSMPPDVVGDDGADERLVTAVLRDLADADGRATSVAVRMIWTLDHIDAARRLESEVLPPAGMIAAVSRMPVAWLVAGRRVLSAHPTRAIRLARAISK
jgi:hypothetical protein